MKPFNKLQLSSSILTKAREFGADLSGVADVAKLEESPSHKHAPLVQQTDPVDGGGYSELEAYTWPQNGKSVIVVAVSHPDDNPVLDWWHGKQSTPGNQKLIKIVKKLSEWLKDNYEVTETFHLPYYVEKGGIFLKDAAVLAGIGCIGRNNLLISPVYGPRVRLRALIVNIELVPTGPLSFNPCLSCEDHCLKGCPQEAFDNSAEEDTRHINTTAVPRSYRRQKCKNELLKNKNNALKKKLRMLPEKLTTPILS